jgi:2-phosphoglycolate phosphatase
MQHKINTILFDLDGTLIDTAKDLCRTLNVLLAKYQLPPLDYTQARPYAGYGARKLLELGFNLHADDAADYPRLREEYLALYQEYFLDNSVLFPGYAEVLQQLESANLQWGIVTNKPTRFTLPLLKHLDLYQRAACVVCGDTLSTNKPDPAPLHYACQQVQTTVEQCLYVGDTKNDMLAAQAANMPILIATYGYVLPGEQPHTWPVDGLLQQPKDLLDYV